jgi:hypothetical protein
MLLFFAVIYSFKAIGQNQEQMKHTSQTGRPCTIIGETLEKAQERLKKYATLTDKTSPEAQALLKEIRKEVAAESAILKKQGRSAKEIAAFEKHELENEWAEKGIKQNTIHKDITLTPQQLEVLIDDAPASVLICGPKITMTGFVKNKTQDIISGVTTTLIIPEGLTFLKAKSRTDRSIKDLGNGRLAFQSLNPSESAYFEIELIADCNGTGSATISRQDASLKTYTIGAKTSAFMNIPLLNVQLSQTQKSISKDFKFQYQ